MSKKRILEAILVAITVLLTPKSKYKDEYRDSVNNSRGYRNQPFPKKYEVIDYESPSIYLQPQGSGA